MSTWRWVTPGEHLQRAFDLARWTKVRDLASLAVLTRVSFTTLVLVPLLAGCWPALRLLIKQYNQAVDDANEAFKRASLDLSSASVPVDNIVGDLQARVKEIADHYSLESIPSADLPLVWVVAFFSALAAVIGQLVYQIRAPAEIRRLSLDEYVRQRVTAFQGTGTDAKLNYALENVSTHLGCSADELAKLVASKTDGLPHLHVYDRRKPLRGREPNGSRIPGGDSSDNLQRKKLAVIEASERYEYDDMAKMHKYSALAATLLYYGAIAGALFIIYDQAISVLISAGLIDQ